MVPNGQVYTCTDLLYRISVKNCHHKTLKIKLQFGLKEGEPDIDLRWPRSGLKDYVKPGYTSDLMTLRRLRPERSEVGQEIEGKGLIGKLNINVTAKEYSG